MIGSFRLRAADPKWSFARTGPGGLVEETAEKVQISDNALTGFYHFSRAGDFFEAAAAAVAAGETARGEFYVAPLYNRLIAAGRRFVLDPVSELVPLGTPEEVAAFGKTTSSMLTVLRSMHEARRVTMSSNLSEFFTESS
ncbi:MAG: Nucleotidyl transferase [Candidatus Uhrbacteria bacterium GW2011_GWD2_52_7]|uniref:Nucleotidyl transferase n=1 Tax=Candidatus Uhrbacteria bacterium GW2011_GWD2_52_7 TaxID=1618989 RepID=A0A0G2AEK7_9BACT|nr:MAG: Nucleotidyl transferase [Candidatus Uhrbacteria bacterium GW2011_GWD2_52_7]